MNHEKKTLRARVPYRLLRRRRRPSWSCACANGAWPNASSRCAWPSAWPSSCCPSSRRPSCARNVSSAPWFKRLGTTGATQLLPTEAEMRLEIERSVCAIVSILRNCPHPHRTQPNPTPRGNGTKCGNKSSRLQHKSIIRKPHHDNKTKPNTHTIDTTPNYKNISITAKTAHTPRTTERPHATKGPGLRCALLPTRSRNNTHTCQQTPNNAPLELNAAQTISTGGSGAEHT